MESTVDLNLFDAISFRQFLHRVNQLGPDSRPLWGKMSSAQMLSHMSINFLLAMGMKTRKFSVGGFFYSWMVSDLLLSNKPYPRNLVTDPAYRRNKPLEFRPQKEEFLLLMNLFHRKQFIESENFMLLFYNEMGANEWNRALAKHLDHHLMQFGV